MKPQRKTNDSIYQVILEYSDRKDKRYVATIVDTKNETISQVHFGHPDYENYTIHKDENRKLNYLKRHAPNEDWTMSGVATAGFWSRWLLWNKKNIGKSMEDIENRFSITFI